MQNAINALGNAESDSADGSQVADLLPKAREIQAAREVWLIRKRPREEARCRVMLFYLI